MLQRTLSRAAIASSLLLLLSSGGVGCAKQDPTFEEVPPADELYSRGMKTLEGRRVLLILPVVDYNKAIESFQTIIDNYPYSEFAVKAELRIADAYFEDGRYDEALSYYRDFGDLHPQHEKLPYTILRSALCHYNQIRSVNRDQTSTREALALLNQLVRSHPFAEQTRRGEELLRELRIRLARNVMETGDFYLKRDEHQAAAQRYRDLLDTYPGLDLDAEALYKLGICYENMRRQDEALRLFQVIVENYQNTSIAVDAADRIAARR